MSTICCSRPCFLLLTLLWSGAAISAEAQTLKRNAVHAEALGPGIIGSVNYERFITESVSVRAGVGLFPGLDWSAVLSPMLLNGFFGKGPHRLEIGAGAVLWYRYPHSRAVEDPVRSGFLSPEFTGTIAYRFQQEGGVIYRAGFTPVSLGDKIFPTVAVSVGFGF